MKKISRSAQETKQLGREVAKQLEPGQTVALFGELGSGKTTFIKGLAQALGIEGEITSPSYTLMNQYQVSGKNFKFCHFDFYRIDEPKQPAADLLDYLEDENYLVAIEWASRVERFLPKETVKLEFKYVEEDKREIKITNLK